MTTKYADTEIEWEIGEMYDDAGDGYCFFHFAKGVSEDGRKWSANATVVFGEIEEITEIEED